MNAENSAGTQVVKCFVLNGVLLWWLVDTHQNNANR